MGNVSEDQSKANAIAIIGRRVKEKDELISEHRELTNLIEFLKGRHIVQVVFVGNSSNSDFRVSYGCNFIKEKVLLSAMEHLEELADKIMQPIGPIS